MKGVPVLFIPGNAGSYKQVRPIAAEGATYFHDVLRHDPAAINAGVRNLDFFTVDFNEDITAFHGQTMLDQAEYLNEAIAYILSLYHDPRRSERDPDFARSDFRDNIGAFDGRNSSSDDVGHAKLPVELD